MKSGHEISKLVKVAKELNSKLRIATDALMIISRLKAYQMGRSREAEIAKEALILIGDLKTHKQTLFIKTLSNIKSN